MFRQIGETELRQAALARAENLPGATQSKVFLGNMETIVAGTQDFQTRPGRALQWRGVQQKTMRLPFPATDTSAQLMKLSKAETFGMLHHHHGGFRHIHAHLDNGGGHQHCDPATGKTGHDGILLLSLHGAVDESNPLSQKVGEGVKALRRRSQVEGLRFIDQGTNPVDTLTPSKTP